MRAWLERHHRTARELWVGFYKKGSGRPSVTWPESVDEALCFGWIDGIRKSIDEASYRIRFTPRRPGSIWSAVNVARVGELERFGRMTQAGRAAFEARRENRVGQYSYEQRREELEPHHEKRLRANRKAWAFWVAESAAYRRNMCWWIVSAKREETRQRRLDQLIEASAKGERIPQFTRKQ
jgi:uncharacterized protein YdeI (YjbR/CyaY-like superfamily)